MNQTRQIAEMKAFEYLLDLGSDEDMPEEIRLKALDKVLDSTVGCSWMESPAREPVEIEMPTPFYSLSTPQLAYFFLRCVMGAIPAVVLAFAVYVAGLLLSSAFVQMMAG